MSQLKNKFRLCDDRDETVYHIMIESSEIAPKKIKNSHLCEKVDTLEIVQATDILTFDQENERLIR